MIKTRKKEKTRERRIVKFGFFLILSIFIIFLGMGLVSAETIRGDDSSTIIIDAGGKVCSEGGNTWIDTTTGITTPTTGPFGAGNCRDATAGTCCPIGQICEDGTDTCILDEKNICDDLATMEECEDYLQSVADKSINDVRASDYCGTIVGGSGNCVEVSECKCVWDGANCNAIDELTEFCHSPTSTTSIGTCTYSVVEGPINKCAEDGFMYYKWAGVSTGGYPSEDCIENTGLRPVPCKNVMRLPFFNGISFLFVICILGIYYFIVIFKSPSNPSKTKRTQEMCKSLGLKSYQ